MPEFGELTAARIFILETCFVVSAVLSSDSATLPLSFHCGCVVRDAAGCASRESGRDRRRFCNCPKRNRSPSRHFVLEFLNCAGSERVLVQHRCSIVILRSGCELLDQSARVKERGMPDESDAIAVEHGDECDVDSGAGG
jgi:hypothetical protein